MTREPSRTRLGRIGVLVLALAAAGCTSDNDGGYRPAVNVTGAWDVRLAGEDAGTMDLRVGSTGTVQGTFATREGAVAQLSGVMDGLDAEFTVEFPAESYLAAVVFSADGRSANGSLFDHRGTARPMRLTTSLPPPNDAVNEGGGTGGEDEGS